MVKRAKLEPLIIQEWMKLPERDRIEDNILQFYTELSQSSPHLLAFRCSGDKYQMLKSILKNFIVRR